MTQADMELRLASLEKEIVFLKSKIEGIEKRDEEPARAWWKDHVGIFAEDPLHEEATRLGREYRQSQREDYDKD